MVHLAYSAIQTRYPAEWLLIGSPRLDDKMNLLGGEVLAHSPDRDAIYHRLNEFKGREVAVEFVPGQGDDVALAL
jgi:hypothetical protein